MEKVSKPNVSQGLHHRPTEEHPDGDAHEGAEEGDDHRLPADHPAGLESGHPHGAKQPDLPGPLDDRQRQRVGDAEDGDDDGQEQQADYQAEQLVDL